MNVIKTIAPIPFEELKKYFEDDNISFLIDVENSELENEKLLTYVSNIDIPINFDMGDKPNFDLLEAYLKTNLLVQVESLEHFALYILILNKFASMEEIEKNETEEVSNFIKNQQKILNLYYERINSLITYNLKTTNLYEDWIETLPVIDDDMQEGLNIASLMKYEDFYDLIDVECEPVNYKNFFEQYVFKGKNLYHYWANENNRIFLFQNAILNEEITGEEYVKIIQETKE